MLKLHNFILEKMSESAHDFDILMNDGSTRSMSHYKEKFSYGLVNISWILNFNSCVHIWPERATESINRRFRPQSLKMTPYEVLFYNF